jgi:hypothetical protein
MDHPHGVRRLCSAETYADVRALTATRRPVAIMPWLHHCLTRHDIRREATCVLEAAVRVRRIKSIQTHPQVSLPAQGHQRDPDRESSCLGMTGSLCGPAA